MKYIKRFEKLNFDLDDLKVGDFIIAKTEKVQDRIGRVIKINRPDYYSTFAYQILVDFGFNSGDKLILWLHQNELLYWARNKEELELIIAAKKYNL